MRQRRHRQQWFAFGLGLALLLMISASAGAQSTSPNPSTSVDPSPLASATDAPSASPGEAPSPSAGFDCSIAFVNVEDFEVLREATVWIQIRGFPANAPVTVSFVSTVGAFERPIGAATTDEHGNGDVPVVVPTDAPFGDAFLRVTGTEGCMSDAHIVVVPSLEAMSIDDETVIPGQRVTIAASGFGPREEVGLYLDGDPRDALSRPRYLASTRAESNGSVFMVTRIPRDISLGVHFLVLHGWSFDQLHELALSVQITVIRTGTLPPTDTTSAGQGDRAG